MDVFLTQDLSVSKMVLGVQSPLQPLPLSPATLLSLVRSQIDLLIEQKIPATLLVKLPPGKIWHSEIERYHQYLSGSYVIFTCDTEEMGTGTSTPAVFQYVHLLPNSQLRREYFLMVLSQQFCSLIFAYRPLKKRKTILEKVNGNKTPRLVGMTTFEGRVIQRVLDGIKQSLPPTSSLPVPADFMCPPAPKLTVMSQLLAKQLQRQEEINRQITIQRVAKVQQQNQRLHNTLQIKDEYLSSVCQELRTPLTHMKTALSLLNSPHLKVVQRQRYLQMLNTQCDRQNSLIIGVLDLVRLEHNLERMTLESIRLCDVVPGVVSTYQPLAQEKGIMLGYTIPTDLPPVWCVSGGLRQIVINLLSNSIKFTPDGGQVWVRGRVHKDYVLLEFRDTGIGIAESEIPKIFDRFYRVRPAANEDPSAVGLGLTIVQQLLCRCRGSLSVQSKVSEGSTFTVQLEIVQNS
ncbi:MAG: ATPase [Stigonema ocellatum SAG 48.90 = DSM 106950]|nr:ATPase [Stigonema ocellatum SAG 48.90 = DSM 106950]